MQRVVCPLWFGEGSGALTAVRARAWLALCSPQKYIDMEEFKPAAITRVSSACTAICLWVRAMHKYYVVKQYVEPKRQVAVKAQEAYEVSSERMQEA